MHIYRIENIEFERLVVVADSFDDAAGIFLDALLQGFGDRPLVDFAVSRWKLKSGPTRKILQEFAEQGLKGIAWQKDGGWEIVTPHAERD